MAIPQALTAVQAAWSFDDAHSTATAARMTKATNQFGGWLLANGATSFDVTHGEVLAWISRPDRSGRVPDIQAQHGRRAGIRTMYRTLWLLGQTIDVDPTFGLALPPMTDQADRPLTADELVLCRISARLGTGYAPRARSVVWALAEATATPAEIRELLLSDLDDLDKPTTIRLPGTGRQASRVGHLSEWGKSTMCLHTVVPRLMNSNVESPLVIAGRGISPSWPARPLRRVLDLAGLAEDTDIGPASVRKSASR